MNNSNLLLIITFVLFSCSGSKQQETEEQGYTAIGSIERLDPRLDSIIAQDDFIEILASGFDWTEGPLWISDGNYLLFSDIPPNRIYKWTEAGGVELYLEPSGYTGKIKKGGEPGSNGLLLNDHGELILCQHGDRRIAQMITELNNPMPEFQTIVGNYNGKKLNSPNDAVFSNTGDLYFTDPPYGLANGADDPLKELDFQGVYRYTKEGELVLLTKELTRPNGISLSPDETKLFVANSDPEKALWMVYELDDDGNIESGKVFYDATQFVEKEKGLPDGLKINSKGILFATGPGGVWIFHPDGSHLGTIRTTQATANCALSNDESILYITADSYLLRLKLINL